jgi:predicted Zn-dependent protease
MNVRERKQVFRRALKSFHQGEYQASANDFRLLLQEGSRDPRHISYCGLLVATAEGKVKDGRVLCELAIREAATDPEMYINLARVYAWNGQPVRAADVLRKGLKIAPQDPGLLREIQRVSPRSQPPVFFLERGNPVNKYLGESKSRFWRRLRRRRHYSRLS